MNNYETIMIINPNKTEDEYLEIAQKFEDMINEEGKVTQKEFWGKRKLAYPIKKQVEGYYLLMEFESKPEFIDELNRVYNITDDIMKHIIVKKG